MWRPLKPQFTPTKANLTRMVADKKGPWKQNYNKIWDTALNLSEMKGKVKFQLLPTQTREKIAYTFKKKKRDYYWQNWDASCPFYQFNENKKCVRMSIHINMVKHLKTLKSMTSFSCCFYFSYFVLWSHFMTLLDNATLKGF